jgi:hypothetical protein
LRITLQPSKHLVRQIQNLFSPVSRLSILLGHIGEPFHPLKSRQHAVVIIPDVLLSVLPHRSFQQHTQLVQLFVGLAGLRLCTLRGGTALRL